jgi:AcrR family transcriptional regulator
MPRQPAAKRPAPAIAKRRKNISPGNEAPAGLEPRGARRKREARARLLEAALKLMAERGMEGVTISEMTDAADMGLGSFYNHFESKEAVHAALVKTVFEDFADSVDRLLATVPDPAAAISLGVRHTLLRALREPLWGQFLVRESYSPRTLKAGPGLRLLRDLQKGIASGRFKARDPMLAFLSAGGTILAAVAAACQGLPGMPDGALGLHQGDIPERTAAVLLGNLGLPWDEAVGIARLPLAPLADRSS